MRDFLPADVRKRNYVIGIIKEVYESYGFEPLETPAVENIETLMGKYGEEGNQLVFKILKRGEKLDLENASKESDLSDLALRYDLTVPLARVVANNKNDLPKFFKRYQIQPVWRADRPARGRFREFYQCDVDAIGSASVMVESEVVSAASKILTSLGFTDIAILLNHRDVLFGLLDVASVPEEKHADALTALDKLDKVGPTGVAEDLIARGVFTLGEANNFVDLVNSEVRFQVFPIQDVPQTPEERLQQEYENNIFLLNKFEKLLEKSEKGVTGVKSLRNIIELIGPSLSARISFHPSLARGLSYYTGTIIEFGLDNQDFKGSIGGGGRYDGLIGIFGKEQIPACGFSLGLERILVVMEERGMFPAEIAASTPADVMVTIWNEESIPASLKLASELRSLGIRVTVYPEADKLGKQFKYADAIKVPFVCVLGDEEIKEGTVKLKNMTTGEEWKLQPLEIAERIAI
ncbi:histidine--tRNA ligase [soil metagenome]